jgi:hypothetical protein
MRSHANFRVVSETDEFVFIEDLDLGNISVTNDAEYVVQTILSAHGNRHRIIYKDSEGQWDELVHDGNQFVDFAPYKGPTPV